MAGDVLQTIGHRRTVTMYSPKERRYYTEEFIFPRDVSAQEIKNTFESVCDVIVRKVHETTEWSIKDVESEVKGITIGYDVTINGVECAFTRKYIPRKKSTTSPAELESALRGLFGSTFKITSWHDRL